MGIVIPTLQGFCEGEMSQLFWHIDPHKMVTFYYLNEKNKSKKKNVLE